jgi:hypothetical protein
MKAFRDAETFKEFPCTRERSNALIRAGSLLGERLRRHERCECLFDLEELLLTDGKVPVDP